MPEFVLAIDQGTTGTTVMVLDRGGRVRARAYAEICQYYPRPGWVEHDPEEIFRGVVSLCRKALRSARLVAREIAAIGITNQRETFVVWERATGRPLHRAIVWQCRRSATICDQLRDRETEVSAATGLLLDPYFSGTKLKWLLDSDRRLRRRAARGELCFGTIDSWLVFRLTAGAAFVTDHTNASRTMLMKLERRTWDPAMLEMLGVPEAMLPRLVESRGPLAESARRVLFDRAIPIGAVIGDQQAALYGQNCVRAGETKVTYGTGAFLLTHTGQSRVTSQHRLLATIALDREGHSAFALEGSVFIAGAAILWLRDELGLIASASESETLARGSRDRSQPYLVPAFVGLGAPYWDSAARGALVGITRGTNRADIVRAALDSIAYQVRDVIEAMERDTGRRIRMLRVDGGATANNYLMQFQADLINGRVVRPQMAETTALGAALLAGRAIGLWQTPPPTGPTRIFKSSMASRERSALIKGWRAALAQVLQRRR